MKKAFLFTVVIFGVVYQTLAQIPSYLPTNGLVGYWPFNGNANDESGNGNHGTVNGATLTTDRFGNNGKAYVFDGASYISSIVSNIPIGQSDRTISFWANQNQVSSSPNNAGTIFNYGSIITNKRFSCLYWPTIPVAILQTSDVCSGCINSTTINPSTTTPLGNWNHVVFHVQNKLVSCFVNGSLFYQGQRDDINTDYSQLTLGKSVDGHEGGEFFNGKIDDIAIYNRALTPQEITALYQSQTTNPSDTGTTQPHDTLRVGINVTDPQRNLHVKDVMRLEPRQAPPANPAEGDLYYDSTRKKLRVYDGTSWKECW